MNIRLMIIFYTSTCSITLLLVYVKTPVFKKNDV